MIHRKTLFILGAGASSPYGFPLGRDLKTKILIDLMGADPYSGCGFTQHDCADLREAFGSSGCNSIDAFLECRQDLLDLGKLAIARALMPCESPSRMFHLPAKDLEDDWYTLLFSKMRTNEIRRFGRNQVSFITFNYDRSLEFFLITAIKNTYGVDENQAIEVVRKFPIVHVHGTLGGRLTEGSAARRFDGSSQSSQDMRRAAETLTVIHEDMPLEMPEEIHSLLQWAENIIFLGMAFHPENMKKLGLHIQPRWDELTAACFGSGYGLTQPERDQLYERSMTKLTLHDGRCVSTLRHCPAFLRCDMDLIPGLARLRRAAEPS